MFCFEAFEGERDEIGPRTRQIEIDTSLFHEANIVCRGASIG